MQTIDAHHHCWKYSPQKHSWISDEMSILKKDFLAKELQTRFSQNGIDGSIVVQADQSEEETNFLLDLARNNDYIKGVVGWVDLQSPEIEERLQHYAKFRKLRGFRHVVQDEPNVDFMLGEAFQNGIRLLEQYNFTYDILIFPTQMEAALQTVKNFPNQAFVIDHIAKPYIRNRDIDGWANYMRAFGGQEHVYCKISGMVTEGDWANWKYEDFEPYLDVVFDAFGTQRIMYGSDFPVCLLAADYEKVKGIVTQYIRDFPERDQQSIMGGNAMEFYKINSVV